MAHNVCRPPWKQCAMLLILLSHAVFGSPVVTTISPQDSLESITQVDALGPENSQASFEDDIFGPTLDERSSRKKRLLYETLKRYKQAKKLALMTAASETAKSVMQSLFKNVGLLGIKVIIFNFLYQKINQVLDFKTRLLNNLEQKNREQNSQVLGPGDIDTAASNVHTTTEIPPAVTEVSTFNPNKISLNLPGTIFASGFSIINAAASIIETLVQNSSLRVSKLFKVLKPLIQSSSGVKSKKREADEDNIHFNTSKDSSSDVKAKERQETPMKNSFVALTQR